MMKISTARKKINDALDLSVSEAEARELLAEATGKPPESDWTDGDVGEAIASLRDGSVPADTNDALPQAGGAMANAPVALPGQSPLAMATQGFGVSGDALETAKALGRAGGVNLAAEYLTGFTEGLTEGSDAVRGVMGAWTDSVSAVSPEMASATVGKEASARLMDARASLAQFTI